MSKLRRIGLLGYIKVAWITISLILIINGIRNTPSLAIGIPLFGVIVLGFAKDSLDIVEKAAEMWKPKPVRQQVDTAFLLAK